MKLSMVSESGKCANFSFLQIRVLVHVLQAVDHL